MAKFGCPLVSDEEITAAAEAMAQASGHLIGGQGARNLAYRVLVELRAAHIREAAELKVAADRLAAASKVSKPPRHELDRLFKDACAAFDALTPEQQREHRRAQRKSWVIGDTMLAHPEMTRDEAERLYDSVNL